MKKILALTALVFAFGVLTANAHEANREIRKELGDIRKEVRIERKDGMKDLKASTSVAIKELKAQYKDDRKMMNATSSMMNRRDIKASTTEMFRKMQGEKRDLLKKMRLGEFEIRKNALVKQLTIAIENLANIRTRLNDRITALAADGKDTTLSVKALADADASLVKARTAVDVLKGYSYTATNATSTTEVELEKPRKIGDEAIKGTKDARDSFKKVLSEIVKITPSTKVSKEGKTN
jgi:hypothetical protein